MVLDTPYMRTLSPNEKAVGRATSRILFDFQQYLREQYRGEYNGQSFTHPTMLMRITEPRTILGAGSILGIRIPRRRIGSVHMLDYKLGAVLDHWVVSGPDIESAALTTVIAAEFAQTLEFRVSMSTIEDFELEYMNQKFNPKEYSRLVEQLELH